MNANSDGNGLDLIDSGREELRAMTIQFRNTHLGLAPRARISGARSAHFVFTDEAGSVNRPLHFL